MFGQKETIWPKAMRYWMPDTGYRINGKDILILSGIGERESGIYPLQAPKYETKT
jgi:hypothetical protein